MTTTTFERRFDENKKSLMYHYCDETVLKSILENKKIWLSDIYKMNDSSEFEGARKIFLKVLKKNKHLFEQEFRIYIISSVFSAKEEVLPLIACFSKNGDLLSQWRAYTNDAKGFSIGFSLQLVHQGLGVNLNSIIYEDSIQCDIILETLKELHSNWLVMDKDYQAIDFYAKGFSIDLHYFKNPSFFEEQEIRVTRLVVKDESDNFIDVGGNSELKKIIPLPILARQRKGETVQYIELPIDLPTQNVIKEIIIGPKNTMRIKDLKDLLSSLGFSDIKIKKSKSTYR